MPAQDLHKIKPASILAQNGQGLVSPLHYLRNYWQVINLNEGVLVFFKSVAAGRFSGWSHTHEYLGSTQLDIVGYLSKRKKKDKEDIK